MRLPRIRSLILMLLLSMIVQTAVSAEKTGPVFDGVVTPRPAPAWDIDQWLNSDPGNVDDNLGKVIIIDFFQLWCPGCNTFTGPLMQQWQDRFAEEIDTGNLLIVKIHTVFEGHNYQAVNRLKSYLIEKAITPPVAVDRHHNDHRPETKLRYRTSGTPEVVIIDREGMIRFQKFGGFDAVATERYIDYLLGGTQSTRRQQPVEVCMASDLCG